MLLAPGTTNQQSQVCCATEVILTIQHESEDDEAQMVTIVLGQGV